MQRFDSVYEIIVCVRSQNVTQHVSLSDIFVASGNVSIRAPVVRYTFDRIVQPDGNHTDEGTVWFDAWWAKHTVEGTVSPTDEADIPSPAVKPEETLNEFKARAESEGWSGALFGCPSCNGINPCGMLLCLHCHKPFLFRIEEYPDHLIAPMAKKIVSQIISKSVPEAEVPDPVREVRKDVSEIARAMRFGTYTGKYSLSKCIKKKLVSTIKWQRKWYRECAHYAGDHWIAAHYDSGYTPFCPGPVCKGIRKAGYYVERADPHVDRQGVRWNNLWRLRSHEEESVPNPVRLHTLNDLDAATLPNSVITRTANTLFMQMQQAGDIDSLPNDDQLEGPMQDTYYRIFGFRPTAYHTLDKYIGLDKAEFIPEVHGWGAL